ncbi:unnamed protein product [Polarella glacialis]|uniref:Uncharacterized protein n=1 Tax=Polarella glacialis TaxID=89957 RepID=A0A813HTT9_POLGL|nr:unnamed protein product [Polarella glacialis]
MEAEEQQLDELDGDEAVPFGAKRAQVALSAAATASPTIPTADSAGCLVQALALLRAACREAERKNDAEKAVPPVAAEAPPPVAAEVDSADAPKEDALDAPIEAFDASAPAEAATEAAPQAATEAAPQAPQSAAEEPWRETLVVGLTALRRFEPVAAAIRAALPDLEEMGGSLQDLSIQQVRALRDEVTKLEKVETLRAALNVIKEVKVMIAEAHNAAKNAATAAAIAEEVPMELTAPLSTEPSDAVAADLPTATLETVAALEDASTPAEAAALSADASPAIATVVMEQTAAVTTTETPDSRTTTATTTMTTTISMTLPPAAAQETASAEYAELARNAELAWRRRLAAALREFKRSEHVKSALEVAAPGLAEKILAAEQKQLDAEQAAAAGAPLPEQDEEEADLFSSGLGHEHVRRLHDELARLLDLAEKGAAKPRALVRAMQMLYLAETIADALLSLAAETADEEALRQLTERSEEFAPALTAMRSLAVDREVFAHLADEIDENNHEVPESESEASDVGKELVGKNEQAPVVLPSGWRLEWVKRKKKEMREFVDPNGRRYHNVRQVRVALMAWEAREAALAAAARAAEAAAAAGAPPMKKTRLRGKSTSLAFMPPPPGGFDQVPDFAPPEPASSQTADLEAAFAEDLLAALDLDEKVSAESAPAATAPEEVKQAPVEIEQGAVAPEPQGGDEVLLRGLSAKSGHLLLNGQKARLGNFNLKTSRWECILADGKKVNALPSNFELVPPTKPSQAKRKQPEQAEGRNVRAKGGRGRATGRGGRGAQKAAATASDSD